MYERDLNEIKKLLSKSRKGDIDFNSLTEEEKMNIRKNLELYYSETCLEQIVATWDGDTTGLDYFDYKEA